MKAGGRNKKTKRTAPKSENVYLKLLVKVGLRSDELVTISRDQIEFAELICSLWNVW